MRLNEFYTPEQDAYAQRDREDTRKPRLTLMALNKLRRIKEIKRSEELEHIEFIRKMYGSPGEEEGGGL